MVRNFQVFDALDFIAELTQHIPDAGRHLTRYFGFYSNKSRGIRAKTGSDAAHDAQSPAPRTPSASAVRRRWAALIKRVWHVDPLRCPSCGAAMKIVSFIEPTPPDVIQKILTHCGLADEPPRATPQDTSPALGELQYVSDLEFVQDPGPAEPVWSAD
ncbi:MAG: transposase [Phycisphaerales bacterium]